MPSEMEPSLRRPIWEVQLGLQPGEPAGARLAAISQTLASLNFPADCLGSPRSAEPQDTARKKAENEPPRYGIDYFFGRYQGRPQSVQQNAIAAIYHGRQGVELWRIMKSVALRTSDQRVIIAHVRGDRKIDETALANAVNVQDRILTIADVSVFGVEYGTVNPFIDHPEINVSHIFDADLVGGPEYPNDDILFTSSGDPRFYVGFDIRCYLAAILKRTDETPIFPISKPEYPRIFARRRIQILGGDSGLDTFDFSKIILSVLRRKLEQRNAYFGDRSLPRIDARSDPRLAGSIDTALHELALRRYVNEIAAEFRGSVEQGLVGPIVSFSSMAMHGVAGMLLRETKWIEYIAPREAVLQILSGLKDLNVDIAHVVLLGLSSAYDNERSAFAGEILRTSMPMDDNVRRQLHEFVYDCKKEQASSRDFLNIVRKLLQRATRGNIQALGNKNVVIILGASELETFITMDSNSSPDFAFIRSNEPRLIAAEVVGAPNKIRLIFIRPSQAVAQAIAVRTLGLAERLPNADY